MAFLLDYLDPTDKTARLQLEQALEEASERAAVGLGRVLERDSDGASLLREMLQTGSLPRALALLGLGGAPVEAYMAEPRDLLALSGPPPLEFPELPEGLRELRRFRRQATLKLAAFELRGELPSSRAATALSRLAEAVLEQVLALTREEAIARYGAPARQVRLVVLALGKLGGAELNYSSDVDLVLVRGDGSPAPPALSWARAFVRELQASSAQGRLYRVDLRLRPYGSAGELVPRETALLGYYRDQARTWERQALLKARVVAGDRELGQHVLESLAPFIWRESLDAQGVQEILRLRERITAAAEQAERDVKLGPGGIRDVEFAVQFLQLLHGRRLPEIRTPATLEGIARLEAANLISASEGRELSESYKFLRRLEHLLQLVCDREVTRLPLGAPLLPLAESLGCPAAELETVLTRRRQGARQVLDSLLRRPFAASTTPSSDGRLQDLLLVDGLGEERIRSALSPIFHDPSAAWAHIKDLAQERHTLLAPSGRARTVLAGLLPRLLEAIAARPQPDRTLRNLQRATSNLGAKATVYTLLAETPDALELLVDLAAGSDVLSAVLARHPGVFDEVVDRLLTNAGPRRHEVAAEVELALQAQSPQAALREVRASYLLVVGALDLGGRANVSNTARSLAELGEGFLLAFLRHALSSLEKRHGGLPREGQWSVLALGKLAGRELSYASDADLFFVYEGEDPAPDGTTPAEFWSELAQEVVRLGEGPASCEGSLLPVDLRLRPGGAKGPLARSLAATLSYYRGDGPGDSAHDFERLALQKSRAVAGSEDFPQRTQDELSQVLYQRSYGAELWEEVRDMRRRQREAVDAEDLKRARGSLADLELTASALALRHGGKHPALRRTSTVVLLRALASEGLLPEERHLELRTAFSFLRRTELRLRIRSWQIRPLPPTSSPEREDLARSLGYVDVGPTPAEGHFNRELEFHRRRLEAICLELARADLNLCKLGQ